MDALLMEELLAADPETKLAMITSASDIVRALARSILAEEVRQLAGARYARAKPHDGRYVRWGANPGSIRLGGERLPIDVPRVRDQQAGTERPLSTYQQMHDGADPSDRVAEAILLGLSQRDYEQVARTTADSFGLSQSSVSRQFVEQSRQALEELQGRTLADQTYLALWLDGKHLRGRQVVICIGATRTGHKTVLGFVESSTENERAVKGLLRSLIERGLDFSGGLHVTIDGSKGLRRAVTATFGAYAVVQRCHWHKRENVVAHLPKAAKSAWRARLREAMDRPSYSEARAELIAIADELDPINRSAAQAVRADLDEVLTGHRLGVSRVLGRHLRTTNMIESVNAQVEERLGRIKRYVDSEQRQRWVALALLEAETRFRVLDGAAALPLLQQALRRDIDAAHDS